MLPQLRKQIEDYISELLAVELPCLEVAKATEGTVVNSICMSLQNINLIHEVLYNNIPKLKKIDETFIKCVDRVQFFTSPDTSTNIYKPTRQNFQYLIMDSNGALTTKEFVEAFHYILFQEVKNYEQKEVHVELKKWQQCLVQLLVDVDLSSYCSKVVNALITGLSNGNCLRELFWQIYKVPTSFLIDSSKSDCVKVTAYFLSKHFENAKIVNSLQDFNELRDRYQKTMENFLEKQQQLEQSLHLTINSLTNRIAGIESKIGRNNSNVYQCMLARKILHDYNCWYEIKPAKRTKKKLAETDEEPKKYIINLEKHLIKKRKSIPIKETKKIAEYVDKVTCSFLKEYSLSLNARNSIETGKDTSDSCRIFYE